MVVEPEGIFYCRVSPKDARDIVQAHIDGGEPVKRLFYRHPVTKEAVPHYRDIMFYKKQKRVILRNCGKINPEKIEEYEAHEGYQALRKAVTGMSPGEVVEEVRKSGLRGRKLDPRVRSREHDVARLGPADEATRYYLASQGRAGSYRNIYPDGDAVYERAIEVWLGEVQPMVAKPHTVDNVAPVKDVSGVKIQPPQAEVVVQMRQVETRTVPVVPVISQIPDGYEVASVAVRPVVVTIAGKHSAIAAVDGVQTRGQAKLGAAVAVRGDGESVSFIADCSLRNGRARGTARVFASGTRAARRASASPGRETARSSPRVAGR